MSQLGQVHPVFFFIQAPLVAGSMSPLDASSGFLLAASARYFLCSLRASRYRATRRLTGTPKNRGYVSDGNEERQESRIRLEQELRENREDRIHIDDVDDGEPERPDS